jgi:hypothetical protein
VNIDEAEDDEQEDKGCAGSSIVVDGTFAVVIGRHRRRRLRESRWLD